MSEEEQAWINQAIEIAKLAKENNVLILLSRYQDVHGEADVIITNAPDSATIRALGDVLNNPDPVG